MVGMVSSDSTGEATLTGPLGEWQLGLVGGDRIWVAAHAFHEDQGDYIFSVLMRGAPNYEIEVARVPKAIVALIDGG